MSILNGIVFKSSDRVSCTNGDIIVLVGPNNVGKSQVLKDIRGMLERSNYKPVVLDSVDVNRPCMGDMVEKARTLCRVDRSRGVDHYVGYQIDFNGYALNNNDMKKRYFGPLLNLYLSYNGTADRLNQVQPASTVGQSEPETHPFHFLLRDDDYRKKLSEFTWKAFGCEVFPNRLDGTKMPLLMGKVPPIKEGSGDGIAQVNAYAEALAGLPQANLQGDGIRSFLGTAMNLVLGYRELFLIDEPECFLHPPQARIIGEVIGSVLRKEQVAIVATHSSDVLRGLLEAAPNRIKVLRLTRSDDITSVRRLDSCDISGLWSDPMLRYSDVFDALFYESSVACEGDADCRFYAMMLESNKEKIGLFSQTKFIPCGGKDRLASIADALLPMGIELHVVPDLDILNDRAKLKRLIDSCGGNWEDAERDYNVVESYFKSQDKCMPKREDVQKLLGDSDGERLTRHEVEELRAAISCKSAWSRIKENGLDAVRGDQRARLNALVALLQQWNIHPVPCGELEGFVRDVGGHATNWLSNVLEQHPSLDDPAYRDAKEFVESWGI